ncbi:MAG: succinylglutamate desuccinylase/aspartoacylase family protein, partial [Candidatus Competibacterales bacterium]|nr:succinylglutamate desuccinylase/aspartoacylase family protein [Candidatus Competibacterales bacterium]
PEQHGKTDLHEVFPGSRGGNLTQKMAHAIATGLLDHVDAHIDYHCGGAGGRLQERVDFDTSSTPEVRGASLELARAFGTVMIHESNIAGSAVRYVNGRGKPAFNAETSGVYLGPGATRYYMDAGVAGLRRVLVALGILAGEPAAPARQACFGAAHRREVNPTRGGFLVSQFEEPEQLGTRVAAGTTLGEIVDLHTLETVEALVAPVDGYLFFSRYSGVVDAGTKAFALADEAGVQWLE